MVKKINIIFTFIISAIVTYSCGVYSFTSGSIPPEVKTISIENFLNESGNGPANLQQNLTEKLKVYYQNNTKLSLVNSSGDWQLAGYITNYSTSGITATGNESSANNRLTISVKVNFVNTIDEKQNFDQNFTFFQDYDQSKSLSEVEGSLIETILEKLVFDIFSKTTSNW